MMKQKRVLILGGTSDAAELARRATEIPELYVISSLAGRTHQPFMPSENTRVGNFGGVAGLTHYLRQQKIDLLVDATHAFAAQMSVNAIAAAMEVGIPHVMLLRPAWESVVGDRWIEVDNHTAAATVLPELARRIFLTVGRQELAIYAHLQNLWFLMRMIESPSPDILMPPGKLLLKRGPFSLDEERSLLQQYEIGAIVSKNSGGDATYAKIIAARELGIPVVMVKRPPVPNCEQVADAQSALFWLESLTQT